MQTSQVDVWPSLLAEFEPLEGICPAIYRSLTGDPAGDIWYYAPGYLVAAPAHEAERFEAQLSSPTSGSVHAVELRHHAAQAQARWEAARTEPFRPICLTVYPGNECNSACQYCYSIASRSDPESRLDVETVAAAARLVAANCAARSLPLTVVLHGGGEPTLDPLLADDILDAADAAASTYGLGRFRYVATNGIMGSSTASWLARRFDLVGLSCDGPDWIQDCQRPLGNGRPSSQIVERTADVVGNAGRPLHVRVTVTPASMAYQAQIAEYVCNRLRPLAIHVEPVYRLREATAPTVDFAPDAAEEFVRRFLEGKAVALRYGVEWSCSMARLAEIHGPYCQVFRDVLQIVPGGVATACFGTVDAKGARRLRLEIGALSDDRSHFEIYDDRVRELRASLSLRSASCDECFNRYHCARACPEACPAETDRPEATFRCRVERLLARVDLTRAAQRFMTSEVAGASVVGGPVSLGF
jgi:uncharacterized protein